MSGYFKSLVKQSGVTIGASNSSALGRGTASRPSAADPITPLHVETVAMVGPTTGEVGHVERETLTKPAYEAGEHLRSRDSISADNDATTNTPTAISNHLTHTRSVQTEKTALDQSEPALVQETSLALETRPETISEVAVSTNEIKESRTKTTPGVIRVGELRNDIDQEAMVESEVRTLARPEFSIPPDYLEGIREWLTAPPVKSDEINTEQSIDKHDGNDLNTLRQSEQSLHPTIELDLSSHEELQEFSLSIGSISIVVEDPARQPLPPATNLQPVEHAPANAQPRANDAFALSRSYFRGF